MDAVVSRVDRLFAAAKQEDADAATAVLDGLAEGEISPLEWVFLEAFVVSLFIGNPAFALRLPSRHGNPVLSDMLGRLRMEALFRVGSGRLDADAREEVEAILGGCGGYTRALYTGALRMIDGDIPGAYQSFIRANGLGKHPRMFEGCASVRTYGEGWRGATHDKFGSVSFRRGTKGRASVVFSGDERYFLNFAEHLIGSVRATGSRMAIHFHVVGWTDACKALARRLDASISSESRGRAGDRTWFATARFYRLATFLEWFGEVVLTDMDISFAHPPEEASGGDVGIRYIQSLDRFPWWPATGGCTYVNSTPAGLEFAASLRDYIAARFVPGETKWWFDQLALYDVLHDMRGRLTLTPAGQVVKVIKMRPYSEVERLKR